MKRLYIVLILLLVTCKLSFPTPQVRDVLYWNGTTYYVYPFTHVEKRFSEAQKTKLNERVKDHIATSNWRGYYFEFEICRDSLFLVSIKDDHQEDLMAFVLGSNARVMMDDFSDTLYLGYGKSFYDPWFPTMIYESEMTVVFKNGIACWHEDHRNKSKHAELPNNTMKWNECIYSSIRWDALDQNILAEKPKAYVNFSTDSLGKVCDVTLLKSSGYSDFDEEAMRVVASLPEFSAHFVCGKYLNHKYTQPVVFDRSKAPNNERWNYTFSQPRSVIMTLQLKTSEETIPSLFYMLQDSVIYDLGKGLEGIYEECIPAKMVSNDAAFAIQVDHKWEKIATLRQLEDQGVCSNETTTLTLLEIKRILRDDPEDPREYKTPPKPYHRALLSENGLPFTGTNWDSYQLLLVTSSVADSLFCSAFLPKQAFDGTYYTVNSVIEYPKASCMNKTMDCFSVYFSEYYFQCETEEKIKPAINAMTFVVDENGVIRGMFCFIEKEKLAYGKNVATKVFNHFKDEPFHPAKDIITGKSVPDLVELSTDFYKTFYHDTSKESSSQLNDMLIECIEDYRNKDFFDYLLKSTNVFIDTVYTDYPSTEIQLHELHKVSCLGGKEAMRAMAPLQKALKKMIIEYYFVWYEYPSSANELISFYNETKKHWLGMQCYDSTATTLAYLENEKNNIVWEYNTPQIDSISLVVIKDTDTLFYDSRIIEVGIAWFSLVHGFAWSYFRYPSTLEELISYSGDEKLIDSAAKYAYVNKYEAYDFATAWVLRHLRNMESDCNWLGNDTELLVTNDNDTVVYFTGGVPVLCMSEFKSEIPMFWPRFYDLEGHIVWGEELQKEWKQRTVWGIIPVYPVLIEKEYYDNWHYFEYTRGKGIIPYCESDTVDTNTPYFKDLEERMNRFSEEKKIGRIIFTAPTRM